MDNLSLIIIDGPKGAGKSTVAQRLVTHLNEHGHPATYHKHLRAPEDEFGNMLSLVTRRSSIMMVVDRLVWTEWVMGIYKDRQPAKELTRQCAIIDKLIKVRNIPHILLLPPNDILKPRLASREELDRQQVDMPWEVVQPLWNAAHGLSSMIKFPNATENDQVSLINYVLVMAGFKDSFLPYKSDGE